MSIAAAISSAVSGLGAVARGTETVAANVSNALTPGYGRREVQLSSLPDGGGVRVASVDRIVSAALLGDRRAADAALGRSDTLAAFRAQMEAAVGTAGDGTSLSDRVATLEAALAAATARPDNDVRLGAAASAAAGLVGSVNDAAAAVEDARTEADQGIAEDVRRLLAGLSEVARLNRAITIDQANGGDAGGLMDERQRTIDAISAIVPIREVPRDNGRIALFTTGGAPLLDGKTPLDLGFAPAGRVTAAMLPGNPPLAGLTLDGEPLNASMMSLFGGGSLAARFAIRDELGVEVQFRLDAFARDLSERFADPALDTTLAVGAPGLFTDAGAAADPATERGLANRLSLNAALGDGADAWRLRDGLGATAPGAVGRSSLLEALGRRLDEPRATASAGMPAGSRTTSGFAADLASRLSVARVEADTARGHDAARADAVGAEFLAQGVDTDREMQRLLELEQAYSANARVITAATAMIDALLEM